MRDGNFGKNMEYLLGVSVARKAPKQHSRRCGKHSIAVRVVFYGEVVPLSSSRKIKIEIEPKLVL